MNIPERHQNDAIGVIPCSSVSIINFEHVLLDGYLLHYSLFLKFSQTQYINWITWRTKCDAIYKNIGNLKKTNKRCKSVRLDYSCTLSQSLGGHPILHWGLKLNSNNLAGKYKKTKLTGVKWFSTGVLTKHF